MVELRSHGACWGCCDPSDQGDGVGPTAAPSAERRDHNGLTDQMRPERPASSGQRRHHSVALRPPPHNGRLPVRQVGVVRRVRVSASRVGMPALAEGSGYACA